MTWREGSELAKRGFPDLHVHLTTDTAVIGATYDIHGGQRLID